MFIFIVTGGPTPQLTFTDGLVIRKTLNLSIFNFPGTWLRCDLFSLVCKFNCLVVVDFLWCPWRGGNGEEEEVAQRAAWAKRVRVLVTLKHGTREWWAGRWRAKRVDESSDVETEDGLILTAWENGRHEDIEWPSTFTGRGQIKKGLASSEYLKH